VWDVGNVRRFSLFPVRFKNTLPTFPYPYQAAYDPIRIDWATYPTVQYLLGWDVSNDQKKELDKFYVLVGDDYRYLAVYSIVRIDIKEERFGFEPEFSKVAVAMPDL
jgi:hypothetical protein